MVWRFLMVLTVTVMKIHAEQSVEIGDLKPLSVQALVGQSREIEIQAAHSWSSFVLVHFSYFALPDGDSVRVSSPDDTVSYEYVNLGRGNLGQDGGFFSSLIPGNTAKVVYKSQSATNATGNDAGPEVVAFKIDQYSQELDEMRTQTICGDQDESRPSLCFKDSNVVPQAYTKSKAVARLLVNGTRSCTGWLVGREGHLLTNAHCILNAKEALVTDYEFGAESATCEDQCRIKGGCKGRTLAKSGTLVARDYNKDFALVKLDLSPQELAPYGYLTLRGSGPVVGEQIYIPQHPEGYAKRIAVYSSDKQVARLISINDNNACGPVTYTADSQPGSSGSPVIASKDNEVVALHRCGSNSGVCLNGATDIREVIVLLAQANQLPAGAVTGPLPTSTSTPAPTSVGANCFKFKSQLICNMVAECTWSADKICIAKSTSERRGMVL